MAADRGRGATRPRRAPAGGDLSPVQLQVLREVVAHARRERLAAGAHLAESVLARRLGTSRTPVHAALRHLARRGAVVHDPNRGFFLQGDAGALGALAERLAAAPEDPLHLRLAEDRLAGRLPDLVSEAALMRRYRTPRSALRRTLLRAQQDGWIEKARGHGWRFQPLIDSPEAYDESYRFRAALEPAGLLGPGFAADPAGLEALRREQQAIAGGGWRALTAVELFESNSRFHETLARWSGNRFLAQAVRRVDLLRRLVEYRQARDRAARRRQAGEHLRILEAVAAGDRRRAAALLRAHLEGARRSKVRAAGLRRGTRGRAPARSAGERPVPLGPLPRSRAPALRAR